MKDEVFSTIALAGTPQDIDAVLRTMPPEIKWDKVVRFEIPGDHGAFPDTTGYEREDWQQLESTIEDPQLWQYMCKCMDAVTDYVNHKCDVLEKFNYQDIKGDICWPKEGGSVFAIIGFVNYRRANYGMGRQIVMVQ